MKFRRIKEHFLLLFVMFWTSFGYCTTPPPPSSLNALALNGNNIVQIADDPLFSLTANSSHTFEGWFNFCTRGQLLNSNDCQTADAGYYLDVNGAGNLRFNGVFGGACNAPNIPVIGTTVVLDNQWHHFVLKVNSTGVSTTVLLYLDGVLEGTNTQNGIINDPNATVTFKMGTYTTIAGNYGLVPEGRIDAFRIYDADIPLAQLGQDVPPTTASNYAFFDFEPATVLSNIPNTGNAAGDGTHYNVNPGTAVAPWITNATYQDVNINLDPLTLTTSATACVGDPITLSVNSTGLPYTWEYNTGGAWIPISSGSTATSIVFTPPTAGNYVFRVSNSMFSCEESAEFTVLVENCCPAETDPLYTHITTPITSDAFWDGKIYIPDNVIINVSNNAILDITTADVVFGECAGIDFEDGALLRANNSVFRPCATDGTWRGLHFTDVTSGGNSDYSKAILNECTFKNAQRAIYAFGLQEKDIRVTNNLFSNCKAGVVIDGGSFKRSITGNTFLLDDLSPDFDGNSACYWGTSGYKVGILADGTRFLGDISQNDFITQDNTVPNFYGIDSRKSENIVISSNNFTDLYRSISLERSNNVVVEANEITVGFTADGYQHQITAISCNNTLIASNELKNTNTHGDPVNNSAIYCELGSSYGIKENHLQGFDTGIQCESASNVHITENIIADGRLYGIYIHRLTNSNVFCNSINMDAMSSTNVIGIGCFETADGNHQVEIGSNCIFETNTAIHLESTATGSAIPKVQNNFLYNYSSFGVRNINFVGDIGTGSSPATGAGRNSFVSNNGLGLTGDIVTNTASLISYGNFGVSFISSGVSLMGNNVNSTASCGLQINLANSSSGNVEVCDDMADAVLALILHDNTLDASFEDKIAQYSLDEILYIMRRVQLGSDPNAIHNLYDTANERLDLSVKDRQWLEYYYQYLIGNIQQARSVLESIVPENKDESNRLFIEMVSADVNGGSTLNLSSSVISELETIVSSNGLYAHLATAILNQYYVVAQLEFHPTKNVNVEEVQQLKNVSEAGFVVYPNPTEGEVSFDYHVAEGEQSVLKVHDITGRLVDEVSLNYQYSKQTMDVSAYPNGIYTLTIVSNETIIAYSKLIKK